MKTFINNKLFSALLDTKSMASTSVEAMTHTPYQLYFFFFSTFLVCLIKVDPRRGNIYWVSCDQNSIGTITADSQYSKQLYSTTKKIRDLYLDWLRDGIVWLEEERLLTMSMMGDKPKELLQLAGGLRGNIAFDLRADSLLWNSKRAGLSLCLDQNLFLLMLQPTFPQ